MNNLFRIVAFLEGVSYILLLFIAVPLKYWGGDEQYVKLLGMPHGILFICYIIMCFTAAKYEKPKWVLRKNNWPKGSKNYKRIVARNKLIIPPLYSYLIASILPFGTFYIDWKYLRN